MLDPGQNNELPPIPGKRYFTIGEVSQLCDVKPHVLRYWEQEFPQLKPVKRRGNRRYYQRQDVIVIRQIRSLLYDQGFTIGGARQRLEGDDAKEDQTQFRLLIKQMISELEDVLARAESLSRYATLERPCRRTPIDSVSFAAFDRGVAQPGSALDWGSSGRRFKSCRPDQLRIDHSIGFETLSNLRLFDAWSQQRGCRLNPAVPTNPARRSCRGP